MNLSLELNGRPFSGEVPAGQTLLEFLRNQDCPSVKQGCDTQNCGLCTVWVDGKPVLSCSYLACRAQGKSVTTLEGVLPQAEKLSAFLASRGAEQCGFCSPGFLMAVLAMKKELDHPTREEIGWYLAGNLCRCSGYTAQMDAVCAWMEETV